MTRCVALAKINGKTREICASGSMIEGGADDFSLWYWDNSPASVCRAEPYSYPEDLEMAAYVGVRRRTDAPGCERSPVGQVTVASKMDGCVEWLADHAILSSIKSTHLLALVMQKKIERTKKPRKKASRRPA